MPWIEEYDSGDVGHGVAGIACSVNNEQVGLGGCGGWIDSRRLIFNNGDDGWFASSYDRVTGAKVRLKFPVAPGGPLVADVQGNSIAAGGGHYATHRSIGDDSRGLYTSTGMRLLDAGLLAMGSDGAVGYAPSYQAGWPALVRELDGSEWQATPGVATALQLLGARRAIWIEGGTSYLAVANLPQPAFHQSGGLWAVQAAFVAGQWWVAYFSGDKGVVLHPFSSASRAFSLAPQGDAWFSLRVRGAYAVRFAISRTQGEGPGDVWGFDIDVRSGACVPLPFGAQSQEPFTLPFMNMADINPPAIVIPTFSFNHQVSTVVFKDPDGASSAPAEIVVNQNQQVSARPAFVADDSVIDGHVRGPLLGVYTEAKGDALATSLKLADEMGTRLLVCHDSKEPWTLPPGLRAWDIPAIETYRYEGETLEQALARWRRDSQAMLAQWPGDCGVVPQFYCMGGAAGGDPPELWPVTDVLDTQRHLSEIVNLSPRMKIVAPFSYLRANGIVAHVELQQSYANLLQAAPYAPALLPVDPDEPEPPEPPKPKPLFTHTKGLSMEIDGKVVTLRGAGARLIAPGAPGTGLWAIIDGKPSLWRDVLYVEDNHPDVQYRATKLPNGRYTFTNISHACLVGGDGGHYSTDPGKQGYHKPTGDTNAGSLEEFCVYDGNENGAIEAQIEQETDANHPAGAGKKIFVFPLTVEVAA